MTHPDAGPSLPQAGTHTIATMSRAGPLRPIAKRTSVWFPILGTFLIMLLLLSFQHVVQGAVNQSAERHKSTALLAKATRLCKDLRNAGASERFSQLLDASPSDQKVKTVFLVSF